MFSFQVLFIVHKVYIIVHIIYFPTRILNHIM